MIAVIFEVLPREGRRQDYLDIAGDLRPLLDGIDGFISIERFESLAEPGKILSLSFWRDGTAVAAWRTLEPHRQAQAAGRMVVEGNPVERIQALDDVRLVIAAGRAVVDRLDDKA